MSDIAKELQREIRDKKRTASGIHSKKGIRGYVGKMLFPYDIMSRKEKYNHRKAGRVLVSNIYDEIISKDKLKMLPKEEQIKAVKHWKGKYSTAEIAKGMGVSTATYYNIVSTLGLSKKYNRRATPQERAEATRDLLPDILSHTPEPELNPLRRQPVQVQAITEGLMLSYMGQFTAEEIVKKLDKLSLMLSDEDCQYEVEIKIKEVKQ